MQDKMNKERRDAGQDEEGKNGCRTRRRRKEGMQDKMKKERRDVGKVEGGLPPGSASGSSGLWL